MKVLYAWEIGDGHGHLRNLKGLIEHPLLAEHEHVFETIPAKPIDIQKYVDLSLGPWQARSFADVLTVIGYADKDALRKHLDAWRKRIDEVKPDVILAESAPTAILAAKERCRVIAIGTPYGAPPTQVERFPNFNPEGVSLLPDEQIAEVVGAVTGQSGTLTSMLHPDATVPFCYASMDMYQASRVDECAGPLRAFSPMPEPSHATFAYLSANHPQIEAIIAALGALDEPVRVYVEGKDCGLESFDLAAELARCTRVVHHGSMGMAQAALGAGRTQFVFPYHVENMQNCLKLFEHGVALGAGYAEQERYASMLDHAYDDRLFRAQEVAARLSQANAAESVAKLLEQA